MNATDLDVRFMGHQTAIDRVNAQAWQLLAPAAPRPRSRARARLVRVVGVAALTLALLGAGGATSALAAPTHSGFTRCEQAAACATVDPRPALAQARQHTATRLRPGFLP